MVEEERFIENYFVSKGEKHLGSINPKTLELYKDPVPHRAL